MMKIRNLWRSGKGQPGTRDKTPRVRPLPVLYGTGGNPKDCEWTQVSHRLLRAADGVWPLRGEWRFDQRSRSPRATSSAAVRRTRDRSRAPVSAYCSPMYRRLDRTWSECSRKCRGWRSKMPGNSEHGDGIFNYRFKQHV